MAQSSASGTSSQKHLKDHHSAFSPGSPCYADQEWESKEAILQRELEETKARAAQMEKTMRWWSDCTANWREKWCAVRDERNKAKKEAKLLRSKLEACLKEVNTYKYESEKLEIQKSQLKNELNNIQKFLLKNASQIDKEYIDETLNSITHVKYSPSNDDVSQVYENIEKNENNCKVENIESPCKTPSLADNNSSTSTSTMEKDKDDYILQGAVPKNQDKNKHYLKNYSGCEESSAQKISLLNLRLEDATKTIAAEREEKNQIHREMEKLSNELTHLKEKFVEIQNEKSKVVKELSEVKDKFQNKLSAAKDMMLDEVTNREEMDRRLFDLRAELEKLQSENSSEWTKREVLESEKISLERENKQLRSEIRELKERVDSRRMRPISTCDIDSKQLHQELLDRNKELVDLKHSYAKLKKLYTEKSTELSHALRRSEQYESEVRRIRARVEELKKELALAQDEVDSAYNNVRRLQRNNEDLMEQLEITNSQLDLYRKNANESRAPDVVAEIRDDKNRDQNKEEENQQETE